MSVNLLSQYLGAGGLRSVGSSETGVVDRPSVQLLAQMVQEGQLPERARELTISEPGRQIAVSVHGSGPEWLMTIASRAVVEMDRSLSLDVERSMDDGPERI